MVHGREEWCKALRWMIVAATVTSLLLQQVGVGYGLEWWCPEESCTGPCCGNPDPRCPPVTAPNRTSSTLPQSLSAGWLQRRSLPKRNPSYVAEPNSRFVSSGAQSLRKRWIWSWRPRVLLDAAAAVTTAGLLPTLVVRRGTAPMTISKAGGTSLLQDASQAAVFTSSGGGTYKGRPEAQPRSATTKTPSSTLWSTTGRVRSGCLRNWFQAVTRNK